MFSRTLSSFVVLLVTSSFVAPVSAAFPDVAASSDNSDAIYYLQSHGIINGYPDGSYKPGIAINRAEFTKIVVGARISAERIKKCFKSDFKDTVAGQWYEPYICAAREEGLIDGYPDGTFHPERGINAAEAAKIVANAYQLPFAESDPWYKAPVAALSARGAIPMAVDRFDFPITRGLMAEMVYRLDAKVTTKPSQTYASILDNVNDAAYLYEVEYAKKAGFTTKYGEWDGRVVRIDPATQQRTTVVQSVKEAIPAIRDPWNLSLQPFARPVGSTLAIFSTVLWETDNPSGTLYSFNPATKAFTKMNANDRYAPFSGFALSPDERWFIVAPSISDTGLAQTLFACDLVTDTCKTLVTLKGNETFNAGTAGYEVHYDLSWKDDNVVEYAVYDQSKKKPQGTSAASVFIAKRRIALP